MISCIRFPEVWNAGKHSLDGVYLLARKWVISYMKGKPLSRAGHLEQRTEPRAPDHMDKGGATRHALGSLGRSSISPSIRLGG